MTTRRFSFVRALVAVLVLSGVFLVRADDFALVSPAADAVVPLVPAPYKAFLSGDRVTRCRQLEDPSWRKAIAADAENKPLGVKFAWKGVEGGTLDVRRKADGIVFFAVTIPSNEQTVANFEIAREYVWRVTAPDGRVRSGVFRTEDFAPRMIDWAGVPNVRDLGGRKGLGGRRVRQGRIYRSAGLNNNAEWKFLGEKELRAAFADGTLEEKIAATVDSDGRPRDAKTEAKKVADFIQKDSGLPAKWIDRRFLIPGSATPGRSRLTEEARLFGCKTLGLRTELDLRTHREVYGMKGSPLGPDVKYVHIRSTEYAAINADWAREAFAKDFRLFLDRANYPIIFHCIAGADRTGTLACILNGLLGVDEEELYRDWEVTGLPRGDTNFTHRKLFDRLIVGVFGKYEGRALNDRIEAYVLSCGITKEEIETFRTIMLESRAGEARYLSNAGDDAADGLTPQTAWRTVGKLNKDLPAGATGCLRRGDVFYGCLKVKGGLDLDHPTVLTDYGVGAKPVVTTQKLLKPDPAVWEPVSAARHGMWRMDVGNPSNSTGFVTEENDPAFLTVDGVVRPWLKWDPADVNGQWDFAVRDGVLYVHSTNNPAAISRDIRLTVKGHGLWLESNSTVSNLAFRSVGSHGIVAGWSAEPVENLVISDCEFENIGGAECPGFAKPFRIRLGNGIEFGHGVRHARVDRCVFQNVYDVAFTMQGLPGSSWTDVHVRDCDIQDCSQAFEVWCKKAPEGVGFVDCSFSGNRISRVGGGWGALVRTNRSTTRPILVYDMETDTVDISVTGNRFERCAPELVFCLGRNPSSVDGREPLPKGFKFCDNEVVR